MKVDHRERPVGKVLPAFVQRLRFLYSARTLILILSILLIVQVVQNQMVLRGTAIYKSETDFLMVGTKINLPKLFASNGLPYDFSEVSKEPQMIIYLQTDCEYCHLDIPLWKRIYAQASERNIHVFAVTQEDNVTLLTQYAHDNTLPFPIVMDPERKLIDQLKAPATPTKILLSSDQRVIKVWQGLTTQQSGESDTGSLASTFDIWPDALPQSAEATTP